MAADPVGPATFAAKPAGRAKKRAPARKPKAGKPAAKRPARSKAKPAKRPAPPEAEESQEQTEPLLLEPIPDDAVVKCLLPLLGVDGLAQLMASSKTICERLGAVGTRKLLVLLPRPPARRRQHPHIAPPVAVNRRRAAKVQWVAREGALERVALQHIAQLVLSRPIQRDRQRAMLLAVLQKDQH